MFLVNMSNSRHVILSGRFIHFCLFAFLVLSKSSLEARKLQAFAHIFEAHGLRNTFLNPYCAVDLNRICTWRISEHQFTKYIWTIFCVARTFSKRKTWIHYSVTCQSIYFNSLLTLKDSMRALRHSNKIQRIYIKEAHSFNIFMQFKSMEFWICHRTLFLHLESIFFEILLLSIGFFLQFYPLK